MPNALVKLGFSAGLLTKVVLENGSSSKNARTALKIDHSTEVSSNHFWKPISDFKSE